VVRKTGTEGLKMQGPRERERRRPIFLPFVSKHGYSQMFFLFAGFTVVYFLVAAFFLPETKGKTLEEIEAHFEGKTASSS
jgi:hypothetical protein